MDLFYLNNLILKSLVNLSLMEYYSLNLDYLDYLLTIFKVYLLLTTKKIF